MKTQEKAKVLFNTRIGPGFHRIGMECGQVFADSIPGQFVTVRLPDKISPLLRRPFSIHRLITEDGHFGGIEILLKVVGEYTEKLSELASGDVVDVLGPLGNGFSVSKPYQNIFIVAGGIGVAPFVFFSSYLRSKYRDALTCDVFIGGRSKHELLCADDFTGLQMNVSVATDDGSAGHKGFITELAQSALKNKRPDMIYACGPMPMLKTIAGIAVEQNIPCQVSIEYIMACGTGACMGCAVGDKKSSGKYLHACTDGPVFDAEAVAEMPHH